MFGNKFALYAALSSGALLFSLVNPAFSQNSPTPALPGCTCSAGTEIQYPGATADNKVFAANCVCGPQFCATTWNKTISLQCTGGAETIGLRPNCADFTKMKLGKYGQTMKAGLFTINLIPLPDPNNPNTDLRIGFNDIGTIPPTDTPNGLHTYPGVEFVFPQHYKKAVIDLATFMGGGNQVSIVTGKNEVQVFPYPADPVHGRTIRVVVEHPDGIKSLRFPANEVLVFEACALNPL